MRHLDAGFNIISYECLGILFDLRFILILDLFYLTINIIFIKLEKAARIINISISIIILIISFALINFFDQRRAPLDQEIFYRNITEIIFVIKTSGLSKLVFIVPFLLGIGFFYTVIYIEKKKFVFKPILFLVLLLSATSSLFIHFSEPLKYDVSVNKFEYFAKAVLRNIIHNNTTGLLTEESKKIIKDAYGPNFKVFENNEYPFLKKNDTTSTLCPYFNLKETKPNIVLLIVESLCRASSGKGASMGSFTPFLDSLSEHSLYWENCLSSSQTSFNALPAITSSLPYGPRGFTYSLDLPCHITLYTYLKKMSYYTTCYYGADHEFDNVNSYLNYQHIDRFEGTILPPGYSKMKLPNGGWTWGYPDDAILNYGIEQTSRYANNTYFATYITISTHPPFGFENQEKYMSKVIPYSKQQHVSDAQIAINAKNTALLGSMLYLDDCIKDFLEKYKKLPNYDNTIFIITGDHHQFSAPSCILDSYHVPLIIYSPLLKVPHKFKSIVHHCNITPSLVNLLNKRYKFASIPVNAFINGDLDTSENFVSHGMYFMMSTDKDYSYMLKQDTLFSHDVLFKLKQIDCTEPIASPYLKERFSKIFDACKELLSSAYSANKIIPAIYCINHEEYSKYFSPELFSKELNLPENSEINDICKFDIDYRTVQKLKIVITGDILFPIDKDYEDGPDIAFSYGYTKTGKEIGRTYHKLYELVKSDSVNKFLPFEYLEVIELPSKIDRDINGKLYIYNPELEDGYILKNLECKIYFKTK